MKYFDYAPAKNSTPGPLEDLRNQPPRHDSPEGLLRETRQGVANLDAEYSIFWRYWRCNSRARTSARMAGHSDVAHVRRRMPDPNPPFDQYTSEIASTTRTPCVTI